MFVFGILAISSTTEITARFAAGARPPESSLLCRCPLGVIWALRINKIRDRHASAKRQKYWPTARFRFFPK